MKKVKVLQFLFIVIMLLALILLTGEIFGQLRPTLVKVFGVALWIGLLGNVVCAVILAFEKKKS